MGQNLTDAIISSEENLGDHEKYKQIIRRLSLVKGLSDAEASRLSGLPSSV